MDISFGTRYQMQTQAESPTTGQTVLMMDDDWDRTLVLSPAGTLASLTITFPSDANSRIGQLVGITTSQAITSLTINGATVQGALSSMTAAGFNFYQKIGANLWRRRA